MSGMCHNLCVLKLNFFFWFQQTKFNERIPGGNKKEKKMNPQTYRKGTECCFHKGNTKRKKREGRTQKNSKVVTSLDQLGTCHRQRT